MFRIRLMTPDDADAVRMLDVQAFLPYVRKTGRGNDLPPRTRECILACQALNPQGCFAAEDGGDIVGYVFSRMWGTVGWIGVFGVHPERQRGGVGARLLARASESLQAAGCGIIGLETMPDWPANVGFYARHGFRPGPSVVTLTAEVHKPKTCPPYALMSQLNEHAALRAVSEISAAAMPGLDYAPEAQNAAEFRWGDTLLVGWPEPWAAVIVRLIPKREDDDEPVADAVVIVGAPDTRTRLSEVLGALEAFAAERGLRWLIARVNAADWQTLKELLDYGFSVNHIALRMMLRGDADCPPGLDMSRWAM
jgi:ribosomal protein S18 acetylase RimI-like enzyme